ncbi:hypothetical protein AWH56_005995 [Anaerobacillus isosaccharinicus]|uniref:Uncharacterized protein n=1 Tax=Anaerobacillus isosaccharinicus TaxID=1532552 RepID=A0A1S2LWN8_9BACI|nr:hypothetical protein [Anaerobacillus isosaccharinicus]MBA5584424.1 hypothetical protein [Anaerobacillus isosaccharinicus]QOY37186.1 hypothetical protein AWH56_005995 [Anaerobacillus isosaccharinicus]
MNIKQQMKVRVVPLFLAFILVFSQLLTPLALPFSVAAAETQAEQVTLVKWDFDQDSPIATGGTEENTNREISLVGANLNGYAAGFGNPSKAINSNGWHGDSEKYWMIQIN